MNPIQTIEIPIAGMDCVECTQHVRHAISKLGSVQKVDVFLSSEKTVVQLDPSRVKMGDMRKAVKDAGYSVPARKTQTPPAALGEFTRRIFTALGLVFGAVILLVVAGEWLGLLKGLTGFIPFPVGAALVFLGGAPIFLNVIRAALNRQIIAHTLMTIGARARIAIARGAKLRVPDRHGSARPREWKNRHGGGAAPCSENCPCHRRRRRWKRTARPCCMFQWRKNSRAWWQPRTRCEAKSPRRWKPSKKLGIQKIELLTGDNKRAASSLGAALSIAYRAGLLPEDKIRIVSARLRRQKAEHAPT